VTAEGKRKVLVVDEADAVLANKKAKTAVVGYKGMSPLMCAGHPSRSAKASEFAGAWTIVHFPRLGFDDIIPCLARVPGADAKRVTAIAAASRGDLRAAFNALELELATGKPKAKATPASGAKDVFMDGLDAVDLILTKKTMSVQDALELFRADPALIPMGVHENYPHVLTRNDTTTAAQVAESVSASDVLNEYMHATQSWDLHEVYGTLAVAAPALDLRRRKTATAVTSEKFGSVWSRIHITHAKQKTVDLVNAARAEHGLSRMSAMDLAGHQTIVRLALEQSNDEVTRAVCWPLGASEVQALMSLRVSKAYKYKHAAIKKVLR
jgi:hypothetical protein